MKTARVAYFNYTLQITMISFARSTNIDDLCLDITGTPGQRAPIACVARCGPAAASFRFSQAFALRR